MSIYNQPTAISNMSQYFVQGGKKKVTKSWKYSKIILQEERELKLNRGWENREPANWKVSHKPLRKDPGN